LLTDGARMHSQWMIDHERSATSKGQPIPKTRMRAAGYPFNLPWSWGENIGWSGSTGSVDITSRTAGIHEDLYVDSTEPDRGHRLNLMNNNFPRDRRRPGRRRLHRRADVHRRNDHRGLRQERQRRFPHRRRVQRHGDER
jgi:hypothetical protein